MRRINAGENPVTVLKEVAVEAGVRPAEVSVYLREVVACMCES